MTARIAARVVFDMRGEGDGIPAITSRKGPERNPHAHTGHPWGDSEWTHVVSIRPDVPQDQWADQARRILDIATGRETFNVSVVAWQRVTL